MCSDNIANRYCELLHPAKMEVADLRKRLRHVGADLHVSLQYCTQKRYSSDRMLLTNQSLPIIVMLGGWLEP
jgi:hypothetical protein